MSDTPRCDQHVLNWRNLAPGEVSTMEFARQLERELNAAKAENAAMREAIKAAYDMCDGLDLHLPRNLALFLLKALDKLQPYIK